ncbi:MAG: flagellar basal body L-ring protein FlgH [Myxococcales bacterium]|nr:flagellar basal body L-ring protein FlgH [Myxococcales bacterium]
MRTFNPGDYASAPKRAPGSLYSPGDNGLYEDAVANRVGDILVILIDERDSGSQNASSNLARKDDSAFAVTSAFGLMAKLKEKYPSIDPTALFGAQRETKFAGSGQSSRQGSLTATLPVRVKRVMPNGDLYVEGSKVVMVGNEEHHIYVSGIVASRDIDADNSVPSSRIADAEIEYTGRGDISDQQRQGWLARTMGKVWPF